jgi:hypothetical protein
VLVPTQPQAQTGIVLATSVMYLRLGYSSRCSNRPLAFGLGPALLGLSAIGLVMAGPWYWIRGKHTEDRWVRAQAETSEINTNKVAKTAAAPISSG